MDSEIITLIIVIIAIGGILLWRIPIARRVKKEELEFIEQYKDDYAILIYYGSTLSINSLNFHWYEGSVIDSNIEKIASYYGGWVFAIPEGDYDSISSFSYNYGNGTKIGGRAYTARVTKKLPLQKGYIYRYRLKEQSAIDKKLAYKTLFEETVISPNPMGARYNMEHTLAFEQIINKEL